MKNIVEQTSREKTDLGTARIIEFSIFGLAGYDKVYARQLNADVNVFFGLNGSGKTSLLKILHSAMSDDINILEGVAFQIAEVKIYSIALDKVFIRTIDAADEFVWKTEPKIAKFVVPHHIFLPIFRIGSETTEVELAQNLRELWKQYSHEISEMIRKAQEKGLANILKAILSMKSQNKEKVNTKVEPDIAYKLIVNFLERQNNIVADVLGTQAEFERRYLTEPHIQRVVNDINKIENDIEQARQPLCKLQQLIQDLFSGNKALQFKEQTIEVSNPNGSNIDLSVLSSGEKQLILILLETFLAKESCILIDEPEISMHIDWQERLVDAMRQLNPSVQIILTTHTPEIMVNIEDDRIFRL